MTLLCSCSLEYSNYNQKTIDGVDYFFSGVRKVCFASTYTWNENEKDITINIPDTVDGYKVVALGGYIGSGCPCSFGVSLSNTEMCGDIECLDKNTDIEKIPVTVRLGKNVKQIDCSSMELFSQTKEGKTYVFVTKFELDDENEYFKVDENGKIIYSKYSPDKIDNFIYQQKDVD